MPLVAHRPLAALDRLRAEGQEILDVERAHRQDIRELHIGLLNIMPDGALKATERQFLRLIGNSPAAEGLAAIIFTGTNPVHADLAQEDYWSHVQRVFDWADKNVTSVLCSCLASHLALRHFYGIPRLRRANKLFGVYSHRVLDRSHPMLTNINTRFDMPHSRWNDVGAESFAACGLPVLVAGEESGVAMASSPDGFRQIYFQGHPEYDHNSLLKEYRRDLQQYREGNSERAPYLPEHYLTPAGIRLANAYLASGAPISDFPEAALLEEVDVTWRDTAKALFANWLGLVYQLTHQDRRLQFMDGIAPADPLGRLRR